MQEQPAGLDPITHEVIAHRLWSINEEGATTIVHASGSPSTHATDYNFGLYTSTGEMAVSGVFYMIPIFVMQRVVQETIVRFDDDISPGDVFVTNDPFVAGVHQSDVQFAAPMFHDGRLVAWTGCMAHLMDVGGMYPGSWCPGATDVFQEGLLLPPARIVSAGVRDHGLWETILANSRLPAMVANDMSAFLSAHRVAHARLAEVCDQYGVEAIVGTMKSMIDRTESRMRALLLELPDGEFEHAAFLDHDGIANNIYKVRCKLIKRDDTLTFDFEGSDPAIAGLGNATESTTFGSVGTSILGVFGSALPWNAGLMRPVELKLPANSIVSAEKPMPISAGSTGSAWQASAATIMCLSKLLGFSEKYRDFVCGPPDGSWLLAQWGGRNQFGESYATMHMDPLGWGGPAFDFRDGVDSGGSLIVVGGGFSDVELTESNQPVLYLWRRQLPDSGGAGRFRGGNGIEVGIALYDTPAETIATGATMGMVVPITLGVFGGYPGSTCLYEHVSGADWRQQVEAGEMPSSVEALGGDHMFPEAKSTTTLRPDDVMNHIVQNAGGFGDPLERDPERVLADVLDGHVTAHSAERIYGVALAGRHVDAEASAAKRAELRARRLREAENLRDDYERRDLPVIYEWCDVLALVRDGDEILVRTADTGVILGPLGENWRDVAPFRFMSAEEFGPYVTVDDRLEMIQYLDPISGRSLWVDCQQKGGGSVVDFRLSESALAVRSEVSTNPSKGPHEHLGD